MSITKESEDNQKSLKTFLRQRSLQLAEEAGEAVLGTLDGEGYPYTSLVEIDYDGAGNFWMLLSNLAAHTKNIRRDVRASLLIRDGASQQDTLATTRASYLGRVIAAEHQRDEIAKSYVARHPQAADFLKFSDFRFYRFRVERVRMVAGFGRIGWVEGLEG
jgi:heme iron utilization protein